MNLKLLVLTTQILLISCASQVKKPTIEEASLDSLRAESLNRRNGQALEIMSKNQNKVAMCHKKEYNKASLLFKESLDKNKKDAHYWNQLGICYFLQGEYSKSQMYLGLSMNLSKNNRTKAIVLNNLGLIQLKLGNFPEAKEFFENSLSKNKRALTPKFNLAMLYSKFGLINKAHKKLFELRRFNKLDPDINYQIAHIYLLKKDFNKAKKYFEMIPEKYLLRDDVITNYATTLYFLGQNEKALKLLAKAPKEMSDFSEVQSNLISKIENQLN
jgi:tetratricopeptide (TPR) repeat protein